jgi:CRP/FNR family transcriptional regulator, anaerobic regulatory protein
MFELFFSYTGKILSFSSKERSLIESFFTFRQVGKKYRLVEEGKIAREVYFINKGLLRLFYNKDGEEITAFIFREGLFAASYDSFLRAAPSIQVLETLEDAELLVISKEQLDQLTEQVPRMNILLRKVAEQRFINAQQVLSSFILDSPEERYRKFSEQHGDLLLRVPHHLIASYLGITPVSFSRIRKRVMEGK